MEEEDNYGYSEPENPLEEIKDKLNNIEINIQSIQEGNGGTGIIILLLIIIILRLWGKI